MSDNHIPYAKSEFYKEVMEEYPEGHDVNLVTAALKMGYLGKIRRIAEMVEKKDLALYLLDSHDGIRKTAEARIKKLSEQETKHEQDEENNTLPNLVAQLQESIVETNKRWSVLCKYLEQNIKK